MEKGPNQGLPGRLSCLATSILSERSGMSQRTELIPHQIYLWTMGNRKYTEAAYPCRGASVLWGSLALGGEGCPGEALVVGCQRNCSHKDPKAISN